MTNYALKGIFLENSLEKIKIQEHNGGLTIIIKVVPGSSRTAISGELGGMLKIKIAAQPEKGKANKALKEFLAKKLEISPKDINIIAGQTNAVKQVRIENIDTQIFKDKLC